MSAYNHLEIEKKWQQFWEENKTFSVKNPVGAYCNTPLPTNNTKKFYALDMFPFPSGAGLHVGHPEGYTATDIICRKKRMEGFEVLHPMGWDAFGLPAENFAIKTGVHPKISTDNNIKNFTRQIKSLGFSYDWNREFSTTDEEYYKWTQWIFLKLYEKGLLYEDEKPLNWCPSCKVVCANEEVEQGLHERCGNAVTKKSLKQWMFKITQYAERLLEDLEKPNVVLLHGWGGTGTQGWFGQIKNYLEKNGIEVIAPDFPNTDFPNYTEWKGKFDTEVKPKIKRNSIVLGHSLGANFVMKYCSEEKMQVAEMVLVAPVKTPHPTSPEILKTSFFGKELDFEAIKNFADNIFVFGSDNDPYIPKEDFAFFAEKLSAHFEISEGRGHFSQNDEHNPEVLAFFEKVVASQLDWPEKIKAMQKNWIGKSEGGEISFSIKNSEEKISVYTTRADTIFSGTFLILSPENPLVEKLTTPEQKNEIEKYQKKCAAMSDLDRTELNKEKTGAFTGSYAINPANGDEMPIWISDFVLASYGTGAVFADAHDERDFEMAKIYGIPLKTSIYPENASDEEKQKICNLEKCFSDKGILINSGEFDGMKSDEAIPKILDWLAAKGCATKKTNYRLRDWIFTRQRYWGEPIPLVHCEKCGVQPVSPLLQFEEEYFSGAKKGTRAWLNSEEDACDADLYRGTPLASTPQKEKGACVWSKSEDNTGSGSYVPITKAPYDEQKNGGSNQLKSKDNACDADPCKSTPRASTPNSVKILSKEIVLCKSNLQRNAKQFSNFIKAPRIIEAKNETIYVNWRWVYYHFSNKGKKDDFTVINIRAPFQSVVIEALKKTDISILKDEYEIFALTDIGHVVKIILTRRNGKLSLTTFYHVENFSQKIEKFLPKNALPVKLPETANYEPSESGESPLAKIEEWVNTQCPCCGGKAKRETSTMPNWAGSSWYYLRFMDAKNSEKAWSKESENFWGPVDLYVGGAEHAVLHLLYARFWHKALYDLGLVSTKEPFKKLVNQGLILSYAYQRSGGGLVPMDEVEEKMIDGEPKYFEKSTKEEVKKIVAKMSKSLKNVVNPDEIIEAFGADTLRMYEMFMGPFEQSKAWDTSAVEGMHKFLARIHRNFTEKEIVDVCPTENLVRLTHQTVKKVSDDIDSFKFNTAISQLMIWMNEFSKLDHIPKIAGGRFVRLLAPFAPHLAEELWQKFSPEDKTISFVKWPRYDEKFLVSDSVVYAVQVNGKLRADFEMPKDATREEVLLEAKKLEKVQKYLSEGEIRKEIFVMGKIVGFVVN